jgi:hypothetical protein
MTLQALRQAAAKKSGGNFTPSLDLMVEFVSAEMAGSPDKDLFVVKHMNNVPELGKQAGDLDKFRLTELKQAETADKNKRARPSLVDHVGGKNRVKKALPGSVYAIEKVWRGRDGVLLARWTNQVAPAAVDPTGKITPIAGSLIKLHGLSTDKNGVITGQASALMPNPERAVRVHGAAAVADGEVKLSFDDMLKLDEVVYANIGKPKAASFEDAVKAAATLVEAGNPGFVLRAVSPSDPSDAPTEIAVVERRRVNRGDEKNPVWTPQTPDEVWAEAQAKVKAMLTPMGLTELGQLPDNIMVELIPFSSFPAVGATKENLVAQVEASKKASPALKYHHDLDSQPYVGRVVVSDDVVKNQACWLESNIVIQHADKEPGKEAEEDFYFRTFTKPRSRAPQMFSNAELPTPNVTDAHVAAFTASAAKRGEDKKERDRKPEAVAPVADNTVGEEPVLENEAAGAMTP